MREKRESGSVRVVAILQARMGSTRLPGKVLMDLCGRPVLEWAVRRIRNARTVDELVVATSVNAADDAIETYCTRWQVPCFRGDENDVLDRYYQAARSFDADVIVRLTGDDPLIDAAVVNNVVGTFLGLTPHICYASNTHPRRTYPRGQDTEVFSFEALERACREDEDPRLREHVTQYIVRHPEIFPFLGVEHERNLSFMRWALDTPEDLEFLRTVCSHIDDSAGWLEIAVLVESHPEWLEINRHVIQKTI